MRLLGSIADRRLAQEFSYYLTKEGIENVFEPAEGDAYSIWVIDEDLVPTATTAYEEFLANPEASRFHGHYNEAKKLEEAKFAKLMADNGEDKETARMTPNWQSIGFVTVLVALVAVICFIFGGMEMVGDPKQPDQAVIITSPVYAELLYDLPQSFEIYNEIAKQFKTDELAHQDELPEAVQAQLKQASKIPYWQGAYAWLVAKATRSEAPVSGPLFVKIRQGEVWRIFSPIFLHADIFHILFNLIWLFVLGNQIELRIGWWRYVVFLLIASAIPNTAQYLISGPLFLGISGVVVAFLAFIWMRQIVAPWEGYRLHRATIAFIAIFVFGMLILQMVSFGFEMAGKNAIAPPIANTAHFVGAIVGALLGRMEFFAHLRAARP